MNDFLMMAEYRPRHVSRNKTVNKWRKDNYNLLVYRDDDLFIIIISSYMLK